MEDVSDRPPTEDHVKSVCKPETTACCRYLTMSVGGWSCEKSNPKLKAYLDARVERGTMRARGDNCAGRASR